MSNMFISIIIPSRGRVGDLGRCLDKLYETAAQPEDVEVIIVADEDDAATAAYRHANLNTKIVVVPEGQPMGALNMAGYRAASGDWLMLLNDDVLAETKQWDSRIKEVCAGFPDQIVLIHTNDRIFEEKLCTFPLVSRTFCEFMGGICPEGYVRYRIDDHIYNIFNLLAMLDQRRIVYLEDVVFEHHHRVEGKVGADAYQPNAEIHAIDSRLFESLHETRARLAARLARHILSHRVTGNELVWEGRAAKYTNWGALRRPEFVRRSGMGDHPTSADTRVTVGVVSADMTSDMTRRCIAALKAHTRNFDLVVIDNNHSGNFCHSREMNRLIDLCRTDYLVLMDDDVFVEAGWLDGLLRCIDTRTALVTPCHKNVQGGFVYGGIVMTPDGSGHHSHILTRPEKPTPVQSICSAIMLIDVAKIGHIKVEELYNKYFLDITYGFRVWEAGFHVVCTPEVTVTHLGGGTLPQSSDFAVQLFEDQRKQFVQSWRDSGQFHRLRRDVWSSVPALNAILDIESDIDQRLADRSDLANIRAGAMALAERLNPYPALVRHVAGRIGAAQAVDNGRESARLECLAECFTSVCGADPVYVYQGKFYVVPVDDPEWSPRRIKDPAVRCFLSRYDVAGPDTTPGGRWKSAVISLLRPVVHRCAHFLVRLAKGNRWIRPMARRAWQSIERSPVLSRLKFAGVFRRALFFSQSSGRAAGGGGRKSSGPRNTEDLGASRHVPQEIQLSEIDGFSAARYEHTYFAVPVAEAPFKYRKFREGSYAVCLNAHSVTQLKAEISRANRLAIGGRDESLIMGPIMDGRIEKLLCFLRPKERLSVLVERVGDEFMPELAPIVSGRPLAEVADAVFEKLRDPVVLDLTRRQFNQILLPTSVDGAWGHWSIERAALALAETIELVDRKGRRTSLSGENAHRLIYNKHYLKQMFAHIPSPTNMRVLEVGCSDGLACKFIADMGARNVVGIDSMRTVGCNFADERIVYVQVDAHNMPFADKSFDMVYSIATFEHLRNPEQVLSEIIRVLAPGGYFYVQAGPLYHSPFGHHMFGYFDEFPWIHLRLSQEQIARYAYTTGAAHRIAEDMAMSVEEYLSMMLCHGHVNGLNLYDYGLDAARVRPDIDEISFSLSEEGADLLSAAVLSDLIDYNPKDLVRHGFEFIGRRAKE